MDIENHMSVTVRMARTVVLAFLTFGISCSSLYTDIEILKEFPSPTGSLNAVLYELTWMPGECSLNVSVLGRGEGPSKTIGNAVQFANHHGVTGDDYRGDLPLRISWTSESRLDIAVDERLRVVREFNIVNGVVVSVEEVKAGQLTTR